MAITRAKLATFILARDENKMSGFVQEVRELMGKKIGEDEFD